MSVRGQLPSVRGQLTSAGGTSVMGQIRLFFCFVITEHPDGGWLDAQAVL